MPDTPDIKDFRLAYMFRDLDRTLLAKIAERARWSELAAGETLFAKNDPGNRFFLVKTGMIKLFLLAEGGQEHVVELLGREHLFAEAVMFMGGRYPLHATALEPTRLISFDANFFLGLLRGNADLCLTLLAAMSRRMHGLVTEIDRLTLQTGIQRFVQYLLAQPAQKNSRYPHRSTACIQAGDRLVAGHSAGDLVAHPLQAARRRLGSSKRRHNCNAGLPDLEPYFVSAG